MSNNLFRWEEGASPAALRLVLACCALAWFWRFICRCLVVKMQVVLVVWFESARLRLLVTCNGEPWLVGCWYEGLC